MSKYTYLNYSTCFDIYGEEFYIYETKLNKFDDIDIELYYGRPVEERKGSRVKLIFRKDLKELIENNEKRHSKQFGEFLLKHTVAMLRRKLKENPYESYVAWRDSKDKDKPREIRIINTQTNTEIITDYLGEKYVVSSAIMGDDGMALPMGIPREDYIVKDSCRKFKKHIITKEIAEYIHINRKRPINASKESSLSYDVFVRLSKRLGVEKGADHVMNERLAVHLRKIYSTSNRLFEKNYSKETDISYVIVRSFQKGFNGLIKLYKSKDKEDKAILKIIRSLEEVSSIKVNRELSPLISEHILATRMRAYKVLMIARDYNYDMPNELRKILKRPYPPNYVKPKKTHQGNT